MYAIYNRLINGYLKHDGTHTVNITSKKGTVLIGLEDVMLFTKGEAENNGLDTWQEWRHVQPRIKWRMLADEEEREEANQSS